MVQRTQDVSRGSIVTCDIQRRGHLIRPEMAGCGDDLEGVMRKEAASEQHAVDCAMARYAAGDNGAFDAVYDGLEPPLRAYLRRHVRDGALVDDLMQRTFLCVIRARNAFIPGAPAMPWVRSIARNLLCDLPKSARVEVPVDLDNAQAANVMAAGGPDAETRVIARQLGRDLMRALGGLPARQRRAMDLVFGDGLSHSDAAQSLRTSEPAVTLLIHKARKALRALVPAVDEVRR
jgi:RNA polymerase sigma-70 factor (ECF subfamily)